MYLVATGDIKEKVSKRNKAIVMLLFYTGVKGSTLCSISKTKKNLLMF